MKRIVVWIFLSFYFLAHSICGHALEQTFHYLNYNEIYLNIIPYLPLKEVQIFRYLNKQNFCQRNKILRHWLSTKTSALEIFSEINKLLAQNDTLLSGIFNSSLKAKADLAGHIITLKGDDKNAKKFWLEKLNMAPSIWHFQPELKGILGFILQNDPYFIDLKERAKKKKLSSFNDNDAILFIYDVLLNQSLDSCSFLYATISSANKTKNLAWAQLIKDIMLELSVL